MERRQKFIIGIVTAALTFGSLTAFVGRERLQSFKENHRHGFAHHGYCKEKQDNVAPITPNQSGNTSDSLNH